MKKGYYYTLDLTLAIIIIAMGMIFLISQYMYVPEKEYTTKLSRNMLNVLQDVKINDVCLSVSPCNCNYNTIQDLCNNNDINNAQLSLLEYLGELYSRNMEAEAASVIEEIFVNNTLIPDNYNFIIIISDPTDPSIQTQLYPLI